MSMHYLSRQPNIPGTHILRARQNHSMSSHIHQIMMQLLNHMRYIMRVEVLVSLKFDNTKILTIRLLCDVSFIIASRELTYLGHIC